MKTLDGRMGLGAATDAAITSVCVSRCRTSSSALILGRCLLAVAAVSGEGGGGIVAPGNNCFKKIRDRLFTCISTEYNDAIFSAQLNPLIVRVQLFAALAGSGAVAGVSFLAG